VKILFDECVPKRLRQHLPGYDITTVPEAGWVGMKNGELLNKVAGNFDVFVTVDRNLSFQQNLAALPIPVILIHSKSNTVKDLQLFVPQLAALLSKPLSREIHHLGI
jgi:hypothetical protein